MFFTNILAISFLIFFAVQLFKTVFFLTYLIQLKEYRFDRIKAHFTTSTGKKQLINTFNLLKWKSFAFPIPTLKIILNWLIIFSSLYNFFFLTLHFSYLKLRNLAVNPPNILLLMIVLLNLVAPFLTLLSLLIVNLLFLPIKSLICFLALLKIRKYKNLIVIGITGSYGKTATKEIISLLLKDHFSLLKTPYNCNTQLGISLLILKNLSRVHQVFVVEMGAYKIGEIKKICQIVKPQIGIITGINEQHMQLFKTQANIIKTKYELIKSLPKNGFALFNGKNKHAVKMAKITKIKKVVYKEKPSFPSGLTGDWHRRNVSAAVEICNFLKISKRQTVKKLKRLRNLPLSLSIKRGIKNSHIIDDSYSANPTGFLAALDFLENYPKISKTNKILVTPGIIELGSASKRIHKLIGFNASRFCTQIYLTKKDFLKPIKMGVAKSSYDVSIRVETDFEKLANILKKKINRKTVILIEGRVPKSLIKKLTLK